MTRVLRVYHSAVVPEYRTRDRLLRERHNYDALVVTPPLWREGGRAVYARETPLDGVRVVPRRGPMHPILFWYATSAFRSLLREFRPDVVDLHEEPYSLAVAVALWCIDRECPGVPVCMYSAQNIAKRYPPPFAQLERRALARTSAMYPCSSEAGDVLRGKQYAGALSVIPLGVTIGESSPRQFAGPPVVGFVGRLERYKGADTAIRAFARVAVDLPEARLEILGAGSQLESLQALTTVEGVEARTSFLGSVPQNEALRKIAGFDALLVPSRTTATWKEQFGRTVAEAFEAGTPVIASDSGSLREVVGDAGILVAEEDVEGFAEALRTVLQDDGRWAEFSRRGRVRAVREFSWERVADDFDAMYRRVLDQAPSDRLGS